MTKYIKALCEKKISTLKGWRGVVNVILVLQENDREDKKNTIFMKQDVLLLVLLTRATVVNRQANVIWHMGKIAFFKGIHWKNHGVWVDLEKTTKQPQLRDMSKDWSSWTCKLSAWSSSGNSIHDHYVPRLVLINIHGPRFWYKWVAQQFK